MYETKHKIKSNMKHLQSLKKSCEATEESKELQSLWSVMYQVQREEDLQDSGAALESSFHSLHN
jgi:hypothetical protein